MHTKWPRAWTALCSNYTSALPWFSYNKAARALSLYLVDNDYTVMTKFRKSIRTVLLEQPFLVRIKLFREEHQ